MNKQVICWYFVVAAELNGPVDAFLGRKILAGPDDPTQIVRIMVVVGSYKNRIIEMEVDFCFVCSNLLSSGDARMRNTRCSIQLSLLMDTEL